MISSFKDVTLLLGSKSPRRRDLLSMLDVDFETVGIDSDETFDDDKPIHEVAQFLAEKKSKAYVENLNKAILITSDTTVLAGGDILNKPVDHADAVRMLKLLSNTKHIVNTGVCLRSSTKTVGFYEETTVEFKSLSEEEIVYYVETYKPFDKAGAYGIQEWIGMIGIEKIEGCYYNVMGLPTSKLYTELCRFIQD